MARLTDDEIREALRRLIASHESERSGDHKKPKELFDRLRRAELAENAYARRGLPQLLLETLRAPLTLLTYGHGWRQQAQRDRARASSSLVSPGTFPGSLFREVVLSFGVLPALGCVLLYTLLLGFGYSPQAALAGTAYGGLFALAGELVCASTVTLLGSGAAGLFIALMFGFSHAVLVAQSGGATAAAASMATHDPFAIMLGGIAAAAPPSLPMLLGMALAIVLTSIVMGNSRPPYAIAPSAGRFAAGLFAGACCGTLIPCTELLSRAIAQTMPQISRGTSLSVAFLITGSLPLAVATGLQLPPSSRPRAVWVGLLHAAVVACVFPFAANASSANNIVLGSGLRHSFFHATVFTTAFLVADKLAGRRAAIAASALEGAGGLIAFLLIRHGIPAGSSTGLLIFGVTLGSLVLLLAVSCLRTFLGANGGQAVLPTLTLIMCGGLVATFEAQRIEIIFLWLHRVGVILIGVFLIASQYLQLSGLLRLNRRAPLEELTETYKTLRALTALLPPPVAILLLFSGVFLVHRMQISLSTPWLFWLVTGFAVFFADGITHYLPTTERIFQWAHVASIRPAEYPTFRSAAMSVADNARMLAHFVSYPFIFYIGAIKPSLPHPLGSLFVWFESRVVAGEFAGMVSTLAWFGLIAGIIAFANIFSRSPSVTAHSNVS